MGKEQQASKYLDKEIVYVFLSQKGVFSFVVQIPSNVVTAISVWLREGKGVV